jgi:hypothetical protein
MNCLFVAYDGEGREPMIPVWKRLRLASLSSGVLMTKHTYLGVHFLLLGVQ